MNCIYGQLTEENSCEQLKLCCHDTWKVELTLTELEGYGGCFNYIISDVDFLSKPICITTN